MSDVTLILSQLESGDPQAGEKLLPLVYDELRKLAAAKLAQEKPGQTLNATALVHEAYLRLAGGRTEKSEEPDSTTDLRTLTSGQWHSRGHFFSAAAEAMRRILVENARRKGRRRHGGGHRRIDFDTGLEVADQDDENLVALDDALQQLEVEDRAAAQVVKLRYFAGLTIEQSAAALGISVRTANRHWAYAKAWLYEKLK
jgi:RNA polymerase sigma factor (sigma-70 family)